MRVSVLPENWWSEIGELGKLEKSPLISSSKIEKWPLVMVKSNKTRMLWTLATHKPGKILHWRIRKKSPLRQSKPGYANFAFARRSYFGEMGWKDYFQESRPACSPGRSQTIAQLMKGISKNLK